MKRARIFFCCFLAVATLGCSKQIDDGNINPHDDHQEQVISKLMQVGFDTTDMRSSGDTVWVEGDIAFLKSQLLRTMPRQATGYNGIGFQPHVTVYMSGLSNSDQNIITEVLNEFRAISNNAFTWAPHSVFGADVYFVTSYNSSITTCARATFPTVEIINSPPFTYYRAGQNGGTVELNEFYTNSFNNAQKKLLIAHELGHIFGIRHTDWRANPYEVEWYDEGGYLLIGAYTVPGTNNTSTNPDPNSVFNYSNCGYAFTSYTSGDSLAIKRCFATSSPAFK